jgi:hypothetical protein
LLEEHVALENKHEACHLNRSHKKNIFIFLKQQLKRYDRQTAATCPPHPCPIWVTERPDVTLFVSSAVTEFVATHAIARQIWEKIHIKSCFYGHFRVLA